MTFFKRNMLCYTRESEKKKVIEPCRILHPTVSVNDLHLTDSDTTSLAKGQIKSEWIKKSSIFQISKSKLWEITALKVYLKLNQKVIRITLSTYDEPSLNMQNKIGSSCPIFRNILHQNFQGKSFKFWVANLENRWLHKFIQTLFDL